METSLELIPIDRSGMPGAAIENLPAPAREVCIGMAQLYETAGFVPPWIGYLGIAGGQVIGTCAFKGPAVGNRVEIAYFTFPGFEGRGYATRMAQALLDLARNAAPAVTICAQTLPEENASTSILKRIGFKFGNLVEHPEDGPVWEWIYPAMETV